MKSHFKSLFLVVFLLPANGCKEIVNMLAFHPNKIDVIASNKLPLGIEELDIITDDKTKIINLFIPEKQSNKLVIYFHGNAGNIYHRIPILIQLHNFGVNVIGVSYRGYGKSEGKPSENGIYLDGKAVLNYAQNILGFSYKNIIIVGRSIGTTVAVNTSQNKEIAGLALISPLTSGKAHAKISALSSISSFAGDSFNNLSKMKNIVAPVLVIHGTNDSVIPYSMGKEIYHATSSKKQLLTIEGAGHNNLHQSYGEQYWASLHNFIKGSFKI